MAKKKLKDITLEDILKIVSKGGCNKCTLINFCAHLDSLYCSCSEKAYLDGYFEFEIEVPDGQ